MKRSGTLTTPIAGLLVAVLLVGMGVTKAKAQSFFRQTGIQLLTKQEGLSNNTLTEIYQFGKQRASFHYRYLRDFRQDDLVTNNQSEHIVVFRQNEGMLYASHLVYPGSAGRYS